MTLLINSTESVIELFRSGQGSDRGMVTANGSKPKKDDKLRIDSAIVANDRQISGYDQNLCVHECLDTNNGT
jgi:hypothetical protein